MEEKKLEAKRKVEALKKQSIESKKEQKSEISNIQKLDEKEILKKVKVSKQDNGITKIKNIFPSLKKKIEELYESFKKLDPVIQLGIIIPVILILIVVGNKFYTIKKTTSLTCTNTDYSSSLKTEEEIKLIFKDDHIYTQTRKLTYEVLDPKIKTLGQLEEDKMKANKSLNENAGVKANYEIKGEKLINTVEYHYYKMSDETIKELGLNDKITLEEYKKNIEVFGYTCKSGK